LSSLWYTPTAVLWLLTWLASPPASLGEAALRESIRRQATTKSTATLTNLGREQEAPPPAAVSGMPPPEPAAAATGAAGAAAPAKASGPAQDEQWWRARMNNARLAVDKDNLLIEALQSRINALQADVVNIDDPVQQGKARQNLGKALAELDNMKQKRDTDLKAIAAIQDEARRSNVPPGWIR
jgi:hypothetical protein